MANIENRWLLYAIFAFLVPATSSGNQIVCPQNITKFEALPGQGFDTIRNREMGRVLKYTYDDCRTTEDGKYLIPDDMYVIAVKDSKLQTTSEFIEHYTNYKSLTSQSMNANAGVNLFGKVGVQASFDEDYLEMKNRQIDQKSFTTRIQMRNNLYVTETSPSSQLDPGLKKMIAQACQATDDENLNKAELICQLIVRNYGTHYIYQAHAGAILLEEDYVSNVFTTQSDFDRFKIGMAAGVKFFKIISAEDKFAFKVEKAFQDKFESYKTSSLIRSIGGSILSSKMMVDDWIKEIANNLVVIDRVGNPLSFLVTPEQFPEFSINTLNSVRNQIDKAVRDYYSYNTHHGCTSINSTNFDYNANVDSGKCEKPSNSYYFGAGYMTCQSTATGAGDLCAGLNVRNPLTGDFRCGDGYEPAALTANSLEKHYTVPECTQYCILFVCWTRCPDVEKRSSASYNGYWCIARESPKNNTGVMFGGLYTTWASNPITRSKGCPLSFHPLQLLPDFYVCISNSYDVGQAYSAPFGGFFSCKYGNPMTTRYRSVAGNGDVYLHSCPDGFSQRMAVIDNGCEVNYCIQMGGHVGQIDIILPPFKDQSALFNATLSKSIGEPQPASAWAIVGGVVLLVVVLAVVVGGGLFMRRRKRLRAQDDNQQLVNDEANNYGAVNP